MSLFTDLRLWEEAKLFANATAKADGGATGGGPLIDMKDLIRRQVGAGHA